jgi:uracil-DNA glycosylase family 4
MAKCRNAVCKQGPLNSRGKTTPFEGELARSGLCPTCHKTLVLDPKPLTCDGCPLYELGEGFAYGEGPQDANIFALGEALGEEEARTGRPFVGGSGRLLNAMLAQAGLYRNEIYVSNTIKCRPPENRKPDDTEIRWCARYLVKELADVNPNLILAVGATALYATTGKTTIGNFRGVPIEGPGGRKVLATFHPAFVMRSQENWPIVIWDLLRAKAEATFPEIRRTPVHYNTRADAPTDAASVRAEALAAGFVSLDLETTNLDPRTSHIRLYGAGSGVGRARIFRWTLEAQALIYELLSDPRIVKVGQNSEGFDWPFLEWKRNLSYRGEWEVAGPTFDVMLAVHLANSQLPKNLATIATYYTDMPHWKDERMYNSDEEGLAYGCAQDVDATARAYLALRTELHSMGMDTLFYKNVMPLQPILRRMANRGLRKDIMKAELWASMFTTKADEYEGALRTAVGMPTLRVESPKQLMELLYQKMGLPVQFVRDRQHGQRPTANADAIEKLVEQYPENKILGLVNEIRSARHTVSTNLLVPTDEDGYVHPRFGCAKASTGRINSWDPNGQNIPKQLRAIYIPDTPEHVFISIDWSQVEWRIAMILAADEYGLDLLTKGVDIHEAIAAEGFQVPISDTRKKVPGRDYNYRYATKFIVYGLGYGRGAKSIAKQLGQSELWVLGFIANFFRRFPQYAATRKEWERIVERQNYLANPFGRRRWWYTRQVTEVYNFPPQSTAADMMYVAIREAEHNLPKGATLRLTVHDELVAVSHRDVVRQASEALRDVMNRQWPEIVAASRDERTVKRFYPQGFSVPADCTYGLQNWAQTKDEDHNGHTPQADARKELGL